MSSTLRDALAAVVQHGRTDEVRSAVVEHVEHHVSRLGGGRGARRRRARPIGRRSSGRGRRTLRVALVPVVLHFGLGLVRERRRRLQLRLGPVEVERVAVGRDAQVVIRQRDELVADVEHAADGHDDEHVVLVARRNHDLLDLAEVVACGVADSRADELARAQILPFQVVLVAQRPREVVRALRSVWCSARLQCPTPTSSRPRARRTCTRVSSWCLHITLDDTVEQESCQTN